jgi:TonB family protein
LHDDQEQALPLWKAALIALALELRATAVFGVDWSFLPAGGAAPDAGDVGSAGSTAARAQPEPQPPRPEVKPKEIPPPPKKIAAQAGDPDRAAEAAAQRGAVPNRAAQARAQTRAGPTEEEKKPEPVPEEPPPLPSVFRDVKPVKKVKPIYPRGGGPHIQGRVKVRLSVDLEGNVTDVEVLSAEPPGVFEEAVLTAVRSTSSRETEPPIEPTRRSCSRSTTEGGRVSSGPPG